MINMDKIEFAAVRPTEEILVLFNTIKKLEVAEQQSVDRQAIYERSLNHFDNCNPDIRAIVKNNSLPLEIEKIELPSSLKFRVDKVVLPRVKERIKKEFALSVVQFPYLLKIILKNYIEYLVDEINSDEIKKYHIDTTEQIKRKQVYDILLTPIKVIGHSEEAFAKIEIKKYLDEIHSSQTYWPQYIDKTSGEPFKYSFAGDCDISDFACGFYEILYSEILNGKKIVDENGNFSDKNFAGDTMTSIHKLPNLKDKYHCLANFWLIPMNIGRTSKSTLAKYKNWSKMSNKYNIDDFMDRFLLLLKYNFREYKTVLFEEYFEKISCFKEFCEIHLLTGSYVDEKYDVKAYSDNIDASTAEIAYNLIKARADKISKSPCALALWDYFNKYGLI